MTFRCYVNRMFDVQLPPGNQGIFRLIMNESNITSSNARGQSPGTNQGTDVCISDGLALGTVFWFG